VLLDELELKLKPRGSQRKRKKKKNEEERSEVMLLRSAENTSFFFHCAFGWRKSEVKIDTKEKLLWKEEK